ncbi:hypothetical protein [uncultured Roseobacter sp.]|uniref:GumC family protein n=1 Tax=uncultured Roseobacter sp. TaxID=114847 RepID=UPI0026252692|nr:hypothetical protein [uncultured Roseobacter sp.]
MFGSVTPTVAEHHNTQPAGWLSIYRRPLASLGWRRLICGGRLSDAGRLPRYFAVFLLGASCLWAPIVGYLTTAPLQYSSHASLILPGSGASASVNLSNIGQASSYASSAFSNGSISPTETYKRLIGADRILAAAADELEISPAVLGKPRVTLVDQTSLIHIELKGASPEEAQQYGDALIRALFTEIDALRADEIKSRETGGQGAIEEYTRSVSEIRAAITQLQKQSGLLTAAQYADQVAANDRMKEQLRQLRAQAAEQSQRVAALETALGLPPKTAAITLKLFADRQYLSLLDDVAAHGAVLAQASTGYGVKHPTYISAEEAYRGAQLAARQRASVVTGLAPELLDGLDRAPAGERATLLSELVRANAGFAGISQKVTDLTERTEAESSRLHDLAPVAAELEDRQRDFSVAEAVFASAIARSESTKTDVYASYPLIQVLEDPSLPAAPSSPKRKLSLAAGVAATLMLFMGLLLAWLRQPLISRLISKPGGQNGA